MSAHKMQHADSPTWCVKCGTFDVYATRPDCEGEGDRFDSSKPGNRERMTRGLFGPPTRTTEAPHE